jgi:ketosteroid isomerase-like protein
MSQQKVEVVRRAYRAFTVGDFSVIPELVDPSVVVVDPDLPDGGTYRGHEGLRRFLEGWLGAWEDYKLEIEEMSEVGDRVVVAVHQSGRARDSGIQMEMRDAHVWTVHRARLVRAEMYLDKASALEAVGLSE